MTTYSPSYAEALNDEAMEAKMINTQYTQTLAAQMFGMLNEMSGQPLAGSGAEETAIGEKWMNHTREHLHRFLCIHPELARLDFEWELIQKATASAESWDEYGA